MAKTRIPKNSLRWLITLILGAFLISFVAGKGGLISIFRLRAECEELETQIKSEKSKVDSLTVVELRLQTDKAYIERVARAKLGYSRPGEIVIKFVDQE